MARELPVGVAQKVVLDILIPDNRIQYWNTAEARFAEFGITVRSRRAGRTSVPVVSPKSPDRGGWNPGGEDGYSGSGDGVRLTDDQRAALAPYWSK
jgi:hypothetical protein